MSDWDDEEPAPSRSSAFVPLASKAASVVDDWGEDVPRLTTGPQGSRGGRGRGGGDRDGWNNGARGRGGFRGGASSSSGNGWDENSANDRDYRGGGRGSRGFGRGGHSNDWSDDGGSKSRNYTGSNIFWTSLRSSLLSNTKYNVLCSKIKSNLHKYVKSWQLIKNFCEVLRYNHNF